MGRIVIVQGAQVVGLTMILYGLRRLLMMMMGIMMMMIEVLMNSVQMRRLGMILHSSITLFVAEKGDAPMKQMMRLNLKHFTKCVVAVTPKNLVGLSGVIVMFGQIARCLVYVMATRIGLKQSASVKSMMQGFARNRG